ncbi:UDP-glycosyltransferase 72E1-like [Punica granatum]|uniref:Glycosyltransferase n=1 Tax=Punica granatum TaxID=22663 RepID=A0A218WP05_PUNGR|nr:UDP-glycosyltransferase 72E1-like [Punica granatum]OWM74515.1 hypothetical protein CDL15_Pgr005094 [Punica granatum]
MGSTAPHVALLASPGMGHLIPMLELGHRLASTFSLRVTVFVVTTDASTAQSQINQEYSTYKKVISIVLLEQLDLSSLMDWPTAMLSQIVLIMRHSLRYLRSAISSMEIRLTALIVDVFGVDAFAVADEFKMLRYVLVTTNAWYLALITYLPFIDCKNEDDHVRLHQPFNIPGCESVRFEDTISAFYNRDDQTLFNDYKRTGIELGRAHGLLVNTWESLEPKTLRALRDPKTMGRFLESSRIFPIGPVVRPSQPAKQDVPRNKVLEWLDQQPAESVLYVSFGSGGTLSADQLTELAWGLEQSSHRFVWVVRPPTKDSASGSFFRLSKKTDKTPEYLPDGFVTRTQDKGLVVPTWAPQTEVLAHLSVGGFLSHCGWNSILESILNGVPMIAWPLYAEQKMNATMLAEQLGVTVKPEKLPSSGIIRRDEIEAMVRRVMEKDGNEGKQMRIRAHDLKRTADEALREGGSSHYMLSQMARECECGLEKLDEVRGGLD